MACSMSDEAEPWQHGSFAETNLYMLEKEVLCDVTFLAGKNKEPVRAHKFMLASRSPVFYAMFCGPLAESHDAIRVPDVEAINLRNAIQFMYTADCTISGENVMALLYVAQKYDVKGLIKKCSQFLTEHMETDNVCTILQHALIYTKQDVVDGCLAYIVENGENVFQSESFKHLDKQALGKIIKLDSLDIEEEHVYTACIEWAKHQCNTHEKDVSDQNIRECLGDILYLIRFPLMPVETFSEVVSKNGVLTSDEKLEVFQNYWSKVQSSPRFSEFPRKHQGKAVVIKRFETIGQPWGHNGYTDAISFTCSKDVKLVGVTLFTPTSTGFTEGPIEILEGDQTIYKQNVKLAYAESQQYQDIMFERTMQIEPGKMYTIKQVLLGKDSFCGLKGSAKISDKKVSIQFYQSSKDTSGNKIERGQFYQLIII